METEHRDPAAAEAAAALSAADASKARLAERIVVPSWFSLSMAVGISVQIAMTAVGFGDDRPWAIAAGLALYGIIAGVQLARFRRLNGVGLGGFTSRVILGTGPAATISYALALPAAVWAALEDQWWLVALCSLAGGTAYALSGRRWLRAYRAEPGAHARGTSSLVLALVVVVALVGLLLLFRAADGGA